MMRKIKYIVFFILFILIFFRPVKLVFDNYELFFKREYKIQYEFLKKLYYSSQYVAKKNPSIITDNALESFAGGAFLKGMNPILIVHDQPPLGRYITASSIILFDNSKTLNTFLILLSLIGILLIANQIINNLIVSLIPVAIFANEPLILNKFLYSPSLESTQLPFIIFCIYFFIKGLKSKRYIYWLILTSIMLGFVISIRFFVVGGALLLSMMLHLLLSSNLRKKIIPFILTLPISLVILILSYTRTIQDGYSIYQIFGIQKYILFYHQSKFILPFSFWDLLLFNRWHTWWGDWSISSDSQWIVLWPISTVVVFTGFILFLFRKMKLGNHEKIIAFWVLIISILLSTGYTSTRYFLPVIPFLYILMTSFLWRIIAFYTKKQT